MSEFKLPSIKGNDLTSLTSSISNYLYQLVEQLNQTQLALSKDITETSEKIITSNPTSTAEKEKQQESFDAIKGLIIKSADIVRAYYESMKLKFSGEYLAGSDFGEYVESTVTDIEVSNTGITTLVRRDEKTSCDGIVNNKNVISKINQSAESVTIEAEKISLEGYTTINEGFSVDLNGNMTCNDAIMHDATIDGDILFPNSQSKIVGGQGLYTTFFYTGSGTELTTGLYVGYKGGYSMAQGEWCWYEAYQTIDVYIPPHFTITDARCYLINRPRLTTATCVYGYDSSYNPQTWTCTNYASKTTNAALYLIDTTSIEYYAEDTGDEGSSYAPDGTEITDAFGSTGWTAPNNTSVTTGISNDISSQFLDSSGDTKSGLYRFMVKQRGTKPSTPSTSSAWKTNYVSKWGNLQLVIGISGYVSLANPSN